MREHSGLSTSLTRIPDIPCTRIAAALSRFPSVLAPPFFTFTFQDIELSQAATHNGRNPMMELLKMVCGVGWACIELVSDLVDGPQKKEEGKKHRKKKRHRESWYSEEERITIERKRSYHHDIRVDSIVPGGIGIRRGSGYVRNGLVAGAETPCQPGTGPVRAGTGATRASRAW